MIIAEVKQAIEKVKASGKTVANTTEAMDISIDMIWNKASILRRERKALVDAGVWNNRRYMIERVLYKALKANLEAKMAEVAFYFGQNVEVSRKLVAFSTDCISWVQLALRDETLVMFVDFRSSDTFKALSIDLYGLMEIMDEMLIQMHPKMHRYKRLLKIRLCLPHIYKEDEDACKKFTEKA